MTTKPFFAPDKLAKIACKCPDARIRMRAVAKLKDRLDFLKSCNKEVNFMSIDSGGLRRIEGHGVGNVYLTSEQKQTAKKFDFKYERSHYNRMNHPLASLYDFEYIKFLEVIVNKSKYSDSRNAAMSCLNPEELKSIAINNEDYNIRLNAIRCLEKSEIDCIKRIRYKRRINNKVDNFLLVFKILNKIPIIGNSKILSKIRSYCIQSDPDLSNSLRIQSGINEDTRYIKNSNLDICSIDLPFIALRDIILREGSSFNFKYEDSREVAANSIKRVMPLIINYSGENRDLDLEFLRDMCIDDENPKIRRIGLEILIQLYKQELRHKFDLLNSLHYVNLSGPSAKEKELIKIFGQICRHSSEGNEQIVREIVGFVVGKAPYVMNEYLFYCAPFRAENERVAEVFLSILYEKLKAEDMDYYGKLNEILRKRYLVYSGLTEIEKNKYRKKYPKYPKTSVNFEFEDIEEKKKESDLDIRREISCEEYVSKCLSGYAYQINLNTSKSFFTITLAAKTQPIAELSLKILELSRKSIKEDNGFLFLAFDKAFFEIAQKSKFTQVRVEAEKILEGLDEKESYKQEFLEKLHKH